MFSGVQSHFYARPDKNLSVRKIFKPLYILLTIFGLFPYSIKFNNKSGVTIIPKSMIINSLCAFSYVLFMTSCFAVHVVYDYETIGKNLMATQLMTQFNYELENFSFIVFCIAAYISAFTNRFKLVKILNDIENMFEQSNAHVEPNLKFLRFKVNVLMMGFLTFIFLLQLCMNFTRTAPLSKMIFVLVTCTLPQMIQFTVLLFYYFLILLLVVLLMTIRVKISKITKTKTFAEAKLLSLQYLESLYIRVFEVKSDINTVFQAQILVTIIQSFHTIVSDSHFIYYGVVIEKNIPLHPILNCTVWISYHIAKVFILARSGTILKEEILKVGQTLHNMPTENHDIRFLLEIQHFSMLMSHQNNDISAYGFFVLDTNLMSQIISSSAMYIIILVQFDKQ
ncbi:uncharacterized protein LOC142977746 [Anticarsia gemmatalis]|uniref:uncharacterized protein LOC142977746 n=1 Tax=Anticarsia gemmatalis TaxID=129554 RepID=UPI003F75C28C